VVTLLNMTSPRAPESSRSSSRESKRRCHDRTQRAVAKETRIVVDDALDVMVPGQRLSTDSLAARDLHAAVTLARVARSRLTRLLADARDEEVSWAEIGRILGIGRLWALLRYGPLWRRRRTAHGLLTDSTPGPVGPVSQPGWGPPITGISGKYLTRSPA
jgi:hypothetical protein